jgi:predicted Zn-dependent protease
MSSLSKDRRTQLIGQLRTLFTQTELGGNSSKISSFSYAGGDSSYSFGILQFDVDKRPEARAFLKSIGFSDSEVTSLQKHGGLDAGTLNALNNKLTAQLSAHPKALETFTDTALAADVAKLDKVIDYVQKRNPSIANAILNDNNLQLAILDYDNQFSISGLSSSSPGANTMLGYLVGTPQSMPGGTVTIDNVPTKDSIQKFINVTQYGTQYPTQVASRASRFANALNSIASGQSINQSPIKPIVSANSSLSMSNLTGDLTLNVLSDGNFTVTGSNGVLTNLVNYDNTGATQSLSLSSYDGSYNYNETNTFSVGGTSTSSLTGNGAPLFIDNANVNVDGGSVSSITGAGITVGVAPGSIVSIGGNGQLSADSQLNTLQVRIPYSTSLSSSIYLGPNSRENVFLNNSTVSAQPQVNFGAIGHGNTISSLYPSSNIWAGTVDTSGAGDTITAAGVVTIADNSYVLVNRYGSGGQLYLGSNDLATDVSAGNLQVYLNGNHTRFDERGNNALIYNNGSYNTISNHGNNNTTYNYNGYAITNNYGSYSATFNFGSGNSTYNASPTDTTSGGVILPYPGDPWSYGFAGDKDKVKQFIQSSTSAESFSFAIKTDNTLAARASLNQVRFAMDNDIPWAVSGSKWDHQTITWSLGGAADGFARKFDSNAEATTQAAFEDWAKASGLTFVEVSDPSKADISIGWNQLDTADTGVIGVTNANSSSGIYKSGTKINIEDPNQIGFESNAGRTVYDGTDVSLRQVLLHEIGHALGLATTGNEDSIESYYLGSKNQTISANDTIAIQSLYSTPTAGPGHNPTPGLAEMNQAIAAFAATPAGMEFFKNSRDLSNKAPSLAAPH